jgi:hypothetical protein
MISDNKNRHAVAELLVPKLLGIGFLARQWKVEGVLLPDARGSYQDLFKRQMENGGTLVMVSPIELRHVISVWHGGPDERIGLIGQHLDVKPHCATPIKKVFSAHVAWAPIFESPGTQKLYCNDLVMVLSWKRGNWEDIIMAHHAEPVQPNRSGYQPTRTGIAR